MHYEIQISLYPGEKPALGPRIYFVVTRIVSYRISLQTIGFPRQNSAIGIQIILGLLAFYVLDFGSCLVCWAENDLQSVKINRESSWYFLQGLMYVVDMFDRIMQMYMSEYRLAEWRITFVGENIVVQKKNQKKKTFVSYYFILLQQKLGLIMLAAC
eukprot:TRINITY_DN65560_c0_g1_i3.p3 TRINITY_DN65560_c0_g1~~TRINITY_DN65560_c0_g1_i3.p3  ORF type:complete len:157 (-),score=7.72 TRINITY_DN65560_c0_g1_i3:76-546(-)